MRNIFFAVLLVLSASGQEPNISIAAGDYGNSLTPLLGTLTESATCKEALKAKDEFETTAQYQRRFELYAQKADRLLLDTIEAFNRQHRKAVVVRFSLDRGEYDADAGVYIFKSSEAMELYEGIKVAIDDNLLSNAHRINNWWKPALGLTAIRMPADSTLARKIRSREQAMRVVLFFGLSAHARQIQAPQYLTSKTDTWKYWYSIGLELLPYRLEVQDPAEAHPVIFSSEVKPITTRSRDLGWFIRSGERCGVGGYIAE